MASRLIGLSGKAHAGKSTAADLLRESRSFKRVRFAGPMKAMLRAFLQEANANKDLIELMIDGYLKEEPSDLLQGRTPRYFKQKLGIEFGREMIGEDIWTRTWAMKADLLLAAGSSVVVDDCRFEDEAKMIRVRGGAVIEVRRYPEPVSRTPAHSSEVGVSPDYVIYNKTGDLTLLRRHLFRVLDGPLSVSDLSGVGESHDATKPQV